MMSKRLFIYLLLPFLVACEAVAPALTSLVVAFSQDLIAKASVNHSPRYALQLEQLLIALTQQTTGVQMQGQLAMAGYQPPPPNWAGHSQAGGYAQTAPSYNSGGYGGNNTTYNNPGNNSGYNSGNDEYGSYQQGQYDQGEYDHGQYDQGQYDQGQYDQGQYDQGQYDQGQYDQDQYDQGDYTTDEYDTGQYESTEYGSDEYGTYANVDEYAQSDQATYSGDYGNQYDATVYNTVATRSARSIQLQTGLLARRAGTSQLIDIEDGATLVDGGSNPAAGDLLKVHFQANCACYVYIIGVDATGYVATVFPDPDAGHRNPVEPNSAYLVPGAGDWWGLDEQKGVEQVIFVASRTPRPDLENALATLGGEPRNSMDNYQSVTQLAVPATRGLVKVKAQPVQVGSSSTTTSFAPNMFTTNDPVNELMVTRWFYHN